jgi:GT2 family glycosyltransferase
MDKIYTVIVTHNGKKWIGECLQSLKESSQPCFIIVVDNLSTDGTVAYIEEQFPDVVILPQTVNLGFGKANNIGISAAIQRGADFVFLLNQDAMVSKACLQNLLNTSSKYPNYGILSPLHFTWKGDQLEYYFSKFILKNLFIYSDYVLKKPLQEIYQIPFVNAAAWFIPKMVLEKVGGFDPIFHHYGEDNNYCQRILYHGHQIGVVPSAYIYHDSKKREVPQNYKFTHNYYLNELKQFQTKFANINEDFSEKDIAKSLHGIRQLIMVNALKFNFENSYGYLKKLKLLKKNLPAILRSRKRNVIGSPHYLNF